MDSSVWDAAAADFDAEPDHGLCDPRVRRAWVDLLTEHLPAAPAAILDAGCGTGTLSLVLAEMGHRVTAIDFSPAMLEQARRKTAAAGLAVRYERMDAAAPALARGRYAAILCRHLLWALPEPAAVLRRWTSLLRPGGRLIAIEGFWHTGSGLRAQELVDALPERLALRTVLDLSANAALWGRPVPDERYLLAADRVN
jgi:SAM-dependent methyltransferase